MTITLKPMSVLLLVALVCALAGFSIGQIANADSAASVEKSSATDTRLLRSIDSELYKINKNVYGTCREISGIYCRY